MPKLSKAKKLASQKGKIASDAANAKKKNVLLKESIATTFSPTPTLNESIAIASLFASQEPLPPHTFSPCLPSSEPLIPAVHPKHGSQVVKEFEDAVIHIPKNTSLKQMNHLKLARKAKKTKSNESIKKRLKFGLNMEKHRFYARKKRLEEEKEEKEESKDEDEGYESEEEEEHNDPNIETFQVIQNPPLLQANSPPTEKGKRFVSLYSQVKSSFGSDYRITNAQRPLNVSQAIQLRSEGNFTDIQLKLLHQKGLVSPSVDTVRRHENRLYQSRKQLTLADRIIERVNECKDDLPNPIKITVTGDKGGTTTKVAYYLNDVKNPLSTKNLSIICDYVGDETRDLLRQPMKDVDKAIEDLKNGVQTKQGMKDLVFLFVADIKFCGLTFGLQNGSSMYGCLWCENKNTSWATMTVDDIKLRTMNGLIEKGKNVEEAEQVDGISDYRLRKVKQENKSSVGQPLITQIPLERLVPPALHILLSLVNSIIFDYVNKLKGDDNPLFNKITELNLKIHYPAKEYNGNESRKILEYFRGQVHDSNIFGMDLLKAAGNIEKFAVARYLSEDEIDALGNAITDFFELIEQKHPDFSRKKTKIHVLQFHVMPFVTKFKSWGLFSEQSIESFHHIENDSNRRIPGTSDKVQQKRIEYSSKKQELANMHRT